MIAYHLNDSVSYYDYIIKMTSELTKRPLNLPTLSDEDFSSVNETTEGSQIPCSHASLPEVCEISSDLENGPAIIERYQKQLKQNKPKPDCHKGIKDLADIHPGLRPSNL